MLYKKITLGIDPGYTNLGLAILGEREDGSIDILFSRTVTLGQTNNLRSFLGPAKRIIDELFDKFEIEQWATEIVPEVDNKLYNQRQWFAAGMLWGCIHQHTKAMPAYVAANSVKFNTERVHGITKHKQNGKVTKAQVKSAVEKVLGTSCRTNHENDAVMVALSAYYPKWLKPTDKAPTSSKSGASRKPSVRA